MRTLPSVELQMPMSKVFTSLHLVLMAYPAMTSTPTTCTDITLSPASSMVWIGRVCNDLHNVSMLPAVLQAVILLTGHPIL